MRRLRRERIALLAVVAGAACLGGCHREPTFDERYSEAQQSIGKTAKEIDTQIDAGMRAVPTDGPSAAPSGEEL
ncbi:hypothetical protein [Novosphingobium sp. 9]|uniref:hypothetical protein n=1 Tax=Novosphingobium sp. 9 TaxID=2025349 RepID=UPI0021B5F61A|nr:hypothetical protein [Novosphingobium sp. 9]